MAVFFSFLGTRQLVPCRTVLEWNETYNNLDPDSRPEWIQQLEEQAKKEKHVSTADCDPQPSIIYNFSV